MSPSLALTLAAGLASCPAPTPVALVETLRTQAYLFYVDADLARPYVSDGLHAALVRDAECTRDEGMCAISADPWIDAQDGEIAAPVTARETARSDDTATVALCFDFALGETREPQCATFAIVRDANTCWVVDDLVAASGTSLRSTFAGYPYEEIATD